MEWISVEDKLPTMHAGIHDGVRESDQVLAANVKHVFLGIFKSTVKDGVASPPVFEDDSLLGLSPNPVITHWMLLSELLPNGK